MTIRFRIVVIGATRSTLQILKGLVRNNADIVGVFSLDQMVSTNVSGFATSEVHSFCKDNNIEFQTFTNINNPVTVSAIRAKKPDILFAVGFSQLVNDEILAIPSQFTVGFHPTYLPAGRGRAPLAWLAFDNTNGASTFFVMSNGVDDGPILIQEPFEVSPDDHAEDIEGKIMAAIDRALDRWVPDLNNGKLYSRPQDNAAASFTGIRKPEDGLIDWEEPCQIIYSKIRAASHPHPGAYTYINNHKIIIWRAKLAKDMPWKGVPGRILMICEKRGALVQAGDGLLWLTKLENLEQPHIPIKLSVGQKLGYAPQDEIFRLKKEIEALKIELSNLKTLLDKE